MNSCQIPKISPYVTYFWAPKGASPLIFAKLNPHSPKMLPTKFGGNQFCGFGECAFKWISLYKPSM